MVFRAKGNSFFLTYSQCNLDPNTLLEKLKTERNIEYIGIGQEHHQDGNLHLHVLINYTKNKDVKNPKYFDFQEFHPKVEVTRDRKQAIEYIKKEGFQFIEHGTLIIDPNDINLYEMAKDMEHKEYFTKCLQKKINYQYAKEAWTYAQEVDTTINEEDEIKGEITAPFLNLLEARVDNKSTVVLGPSGVGKTVFVKRNATKPALFVSHIDDLRSFDARRHKSIIFDDMSFTHLPLQGQIHLADIFEPRSIHVRYGTVKIPAGVEKWFTCNTRTFADHPAIRRRIYEINLY